MQKGFFLLSLALFAFFYPTLSSAQQTVGLFSKDSGQQNGYVLFYPNASKNTYLIDKCGKNIHDWNTKYLPGLDAYILSNGNLLSTGSLTNPYFNSVGSGGGLLQIFDWSGNLLWKYTISNNIEKQDHDVYPMPNGDVLVCEWERITNAEAIAAGRDSVKLAKSNIWSAKVQEIKPIGTDSAQIVWQWRLWDHLVQDHDSTKPGYGTVANHPELLNVNYVDSTESNVVFGDSDWIHANAVFYNADLDQVMISARSMSEIWIIDHSTTTAEAAMHSGGNHGRGGDFLYRWGNPAAYNRASSGKRTLYVQHDASWIPDGFPGAGHITVFNNGTARPDGSYSSADEFVPPVDQDGDYYLASGATYGPDSSIWSYKAPVRTDFYSTVQGSVQRLPNGNTMICEAEKGNFFEVDSSKNVLWKYVCPVGNSGAYPQGIKPVNNVSFRCQWYDINYPGFKNFTLTPGNPIELNPYPYNCTMPYVLYNRPLYKIVQVKGYNSITGVADSLNTYCYLKGIVQSANLSSNNTQFFSLQDSTGAIIVNSGTIIDKYVPVVGDSVVVRGTVLQSKGLTYFADDSISQLNSTTEISPVLVTTLGENTESGLVTLDGYKLIDSTQWDTTDANGSFKIKAVNQEEDTLTLAIVKGTNLYLNSAKPIGTFDVTGIESQNDSTTPYFSNYYLIPRSLQDFEYGSGISPQNQINAEINIYPNPASGSINITSSLRITNVEITDIVGRVLLTQVLGNSNKRSLDISALTQGIYFVKVYSGANYQMEKIVKD